MQPQTHLNGEAGDPTPVWFYVAGDLPQGPFTHAEILAKFEAGEISAGTTVYRNGESHWRTLAKEPAFAAYFGAHPERKRTSVWRNGWLWTALFFLLLAAFPILSTFVVQKDKLEEDVKVAFVDLCNERQLSVDRNDVTAVKLTKEAPNVYVGTITVKNAEGQLHALPITVTVGGDAMKARTFTFVIDDTTHWLREHF